MDDKKQDEDKKDDKPMSAHDQVMLAHAGTVIGHVNSVVHAVHQGADPAVIAVHIEHARDAAVDLAQHENSRPAPAPTTPSPEPRNMVAPPGTKPTPVLALPAVVWNPAAAKPAVQAAAKSWVRANLGTVIAAAVAVVLGVAVYMQHAGISLLR